MVGMQKKIAQIFESDGRGIREWTPAEWAWTATLLFVLLRFFTPLPTLLLYIVYTLVMLFLAWKGRSTFVGAHRDWALGIPLLLLLVVSAALVIWSPYSTLLLIKYVMFVVDLTILVVLLKVHEIPGMTRLFYLISTGIVALTFLIYVINPQAYVSIPGAGQGLVTAPIFLGMPDNNDSAFVIFLLFCLSLKKRWIAGIVLGLIYPFLYFGRLYILMLCCVLFLTLLVCVLRKFHVLPAEEHAFKIHPLVFLALFVVSTASIVAFSYFWTTSVVGEETTSYKASFNDSSNALRTNSTVYCFELVTSDPDFILYGYDNDAFEELGISRTDFSPEANYLVKGRYRLVQPHEEVLNTIVKEGFLFTAVYYYVLSVLLSRMRWNTRNIVIFLAYLFGSMFLAGYFRDFRLLACSLVLAAATLPGTRRSDADTGTCDADTGLLQEATEKD